MATISIHPAVDHGLSPAAANFAGGTLQCRCADKKVTVSIKGQSAHNHVCGCTRCWKPSGALFSQVAVVPRENLSVDANGDKLAGRRSRPRRSSAMHARIAACTCMEGSRIAGHPFYGLDFIHTELSYRAGLVAAGIRGIRLLDHRVGGRPGQHG